MNFPHAPSRRGFLAGASGTLLAYALLQSRAAAGPLGDAASAAVNWSKRAAGTDERPRYIHSLARGLAMIPGRAPVVAVAERGLYAVAARPASAADRARLAGEERIGEGATLMRSKFFGVVLDPWRMQPVDEHYNEVTGTRLPVAARRVDETMLFAGPNAVVRAGDEAPRSRRISEASFGEETIITSFETVLPAADARPIVRSLSYRAAAQPDGTPHVDFSMSMLFPAQDWPWLGFARELNAQIMWNVTGRSIDDFSSMDAAFLARFDAEDEFRSFRR